MHTHSPTGTLQTHTHSHADTVTHCSELPRNTFGCLDSWEAQTLRSQRQHPNARTRTNAHAQRTHSHMHSPCRSPSAHSPLAHDPLPIATTGVHTGLAPSPAHASTFAHSKRPALREYQGTYWVPKCDAGRSVLRRVPNGICGHGSPQPRVRGRGFSPLP